MARTLLAPEVEANRVLQRAKDEYASLEIKWDNYRIDVELIAALLFDLGVQRVSLKIGNRQYAGVLDAQGRNIGIEQEHHPNRQRFSVAHEIGHYTLHVVHERPSDGPYVCSAQDMEIGRTAVTGSPKTHLRRELEANTFAAALLMPEDAVLRMFHIVNGSVERLAGHFQVSSEAMEIRLRQLDVPFSYRRR